MSRSRFFALILTLLASGAAAQDQPAAPAELTELNWPRKYEDAGDQIVVYDPQIESWEKHELLKGRSAVVVTASGEKQEAFGIFEFEVKTETQPESRQALLKERTITAVRFSGLPKEKADKAEAIVRRILGKRPTVKLSLDFILTYIKEKAVEVPSVKVNIKPPPIYVSTLPAILVIFLGEPDFKPIKGTTLRFATNTNWDIVLNPADLRYYLLNGEGWISTKDLKKGPWDYVTKLPDEFFKIPRDENWSEAWKAMPGKLVAIPRVYVTLEPAEMILIDGAPNYAPIAGTRLSAVSNTESDLFRDEGEGSFYFLTAGRWFKTKTLDGAWAAATGELPAEFAKIPKDHPDSEVLASVPGTQEADDAVLLASVPRKATVQRKGVTLSVTYEGDPKFEAIESTGVAYAVNSPYSVLKVRDRYYCCYEAIWFESPTPTGPWEVCVNVPKEIYTIPETHPKYNVTYVTVYESTDEEVVVGYTSGYTGMYCYGGVMMFGLGYAMLYPPYWYYHYPCHWYAYGCGARYGWYGGAYYRGGWGYGPYGGAGFVAGYNPVTGAYARGAYAYGPYGGSRYAAQSFNPYTGTYKARSGGSTPYSSWGRGVAVQGNDWVRGGYYSNSRGTIAGAEGSGGGKVVGVGNGQGDRTFVGQGQNGDIYAGRDGNVYRKNDDGWSKFSDGSWNSVGAGDNRPSAGTRDVPRAENRDLPRAESRDLPKAGTRDLPRSSSSFDDTIQRLQRDSANRTRATQATRQYNSAPRASGGARGGGGRGGGRR